MGLAHVLPWLDHGHSKQTVGPVAKRATSQKQRFQPHLQKSWPADRNAIAFISQKGLLFAAYEASNAGRS